MRAALLTTLLALLLPAAAPAKIVPGKSIAGIEVGMTRAEVEERLGEPDEVRRPRHEIFGRYIELRYGLTRIGHFRSDETVFSVRTRSRRQRTSRDIGVGSSRRAVRRRVPRVRCENEHGFRHCYIGRFVPGRIVMDFLLTRDDRVKEVVLARVID